MKCFIVSGQDPDEVEIEINEWLIRSEAEIPGFKVLHIKQSVMPPDSSMSLTEDPSRQPELEPWLVVSLWWVEGRDQ